MNVKHNTPLQIYCDMDGVLTDFNGRFEEFTGMLPDTYQEVHGKESLYKIISQVGEPYWTGMSWTEGGRELWKFIQKYNPILLSTPMKDPVSRTGKRKWVEDNIFPAPKLILSSHKSKYATPHSILIDDMDKNLLPWKEAGGISIKCKDGDTRISE